METEKRASLGHDIALTRSSNSGPVDNYDPAKASEMIHLKLKLKSFSRPHLLMEEKKTLTAFSDPESESIVFCSINFCGSLSVSLRGNL